MRKINVARTVTKITNLQEKITGLLAQVQGALDSASEKQKPAVKPTRAPKRSRVEELKKPSKSKFVKIVEAKATKNKAKKVRLAKMVDELAGLAKAIKNSGKTKNGSKIKAKKTVKEAVKPKKKLKVQEKPVKASKKVKPMKPAKTHKRVELNGD